MSYEWFPSNAAQWMSAFSFYYPLFMAWVWIAGALYYWRQYERHMPPINKPPELKDKPKVAVLVPCRNEEDNVYETTRAVLASKYPNLEVIVIDDASNDSTGAILDVMAMRSRRLRVVHLEENQGKANGLNTAIALTDASIIVVIDGDALLHPWALHWLVWHFRWARVGAVTGNPRIRTRSTLLGSLQVGEFSSTIGLIKRAQRTYGRVFTVSGVVAAFRRTALHDVGYFSADMLTEDVDVSWKLQMAHWDVRFEPNALCWILMPETLRGLWKQRLRWATGGTQVLRKNLRALMRWRQRRMWPVFIEYATSVAWAYTMFILCLCWLFGTVLGLPVPIYVETLLPQWTGVIVGTTCLIQIAVGLALDARHEKGLRRTYWWMIWYPLAYWTLSMFTTIVGLPKALARQKGETARWASSDRGISPAVR
ncbi:MAG: poly-beta-1,6-N-acetyl-D-glucosamine synthase [Burkholderiaceae bacterium]